MKYQFPSWRNVIFQLLVASVSVALYYYTSRALQPTTELGGAWQTTNYFFYLLSGEIFIMLPIALTGNFSRSTRYLANQGILYEILANSSHKYKKLIASTLMLSIRECTSTVMILFIACVFFDFRFSLTGGALALLLLVSSLPLFLFLGATLGSLTLYFGRGDGVVTAYTLLLTVVSGLYFPIDVFPHALQIAIKALIPHAIYISAIRTTLLTGSMQLMHALLIAQFIVYAGIFLTLSRFIFNQAVVKIRRCGLPNLYHP